MSFRMRNEEKSYKVYKVNIAGSIRFLSSFEMTFFFLKVLISNLNN
ncbi:MAG: hypothetical protein JWR38_5414 [Mucilaginibacter sp.]|nr:hypothetical protein [Mucilaginibacter sp.]